MSAASLRTRSLCSGARAASGYTVIEILMAMTVLTIGAAAAMSMQKVSMQGNLDARQMDLATGIGRMWMERLRKDAMSWTLPNAVNATSNFSNTQLLSVYAGQGWSRPDNYQPATPLAAVSPGFDMLGRDVPRAQLDGSPPPFFCVHINESWVGGNGSTTDSVLRVDLRVVWPRGIANVSTKSACDNSVVTAAWPDNTKYAAVYLSTLITSNGVP
jgi:prepilin-type N-terminal cleavage/methylation domain-containing protein